MACPLWPQETTYIVQPVKSLRHICSRASRVRLAKSSASNRNRSKLVARYSMCPDLQMLVGSIPSRQDLFLAASAVAEICHHAMLGVLDGVSVRHQHLLLRVSAIDVARLKSLRSHAWRSVPLHCSIEASMHECRVGLVMSGWPSYKKCATRIPHRIWGICRVSHVAAQAQLQCWATNNARDLRRTVFSQCVWHNCDFGFLEYVSCQKTRADQTAARPSASQACNTFAAIIQTRPSAQRLAICCMRST
jgi:hypothetical protein